VEAKDKWELAMDDEIESLMKNQIDSHAQQIWLNKIRKSCTTNLFID